MQCRLSNHSRKEQQPRLYVSLPYFKFVILGPILGYFSQPPDVSATTTSLSARFPFSGSWDHGWGELRKRLCPPNPLLCYVCGTSAHDNHENTTVPLSTPFRTLEVLQHKIGITAEIRSAECRKSFSSLLLPPAPSFTSSSILQSSQKHI